MYKRQFLEKYHNEYVKLWHECQELIHDDNLWNGSYFFDNLETEISDIFGIQLERGSVIDYKSSSIFFNKNKSNLSEFFS